MGEITSSSTLAGVLGLALGVRFLVGVSLVSLSPDARVGVPFALYVLSALANGGGSFQHTSFDISGVRKRRGPICDHRGRGWGFQHTPFEVGGDEQAAETDVDRTKKPTKSSNKGRSYGGRLRGYSTGFSWTIFKLLLRSDGQKQLSQGCSIKRILRTG